MDRIQLRRDTSNNWKLVNPILLEGEVGFEIDTKLRKIGDGVNRWNDLEYLRAEGISQETGNNQNITMSQDAITRELTELDSKVGVVTEHTDYPARRDLSLDKVNNYGGYKISLKELYEQGISHVVFKGSDYASTSSVTAGVVVDVDGNVESYIPYEAKFNTFRKLPITENSDYLWATYVKSGDNEWNPTKVYFLEPIDAEIIKDISNIENVIDNIKGAVSFDKPILYEGSVSGGGRPLPETNPLIKKHTDMLEVIGDIHIETKEGFVLAYYIYDIDGVYKSNDEDYKSSLDIEKFDGYIRFIFKKTDNSQFSVDSDVVNVINGVYIVPNTQSLLKDIELLKDEIKQLEVNDSKISKEIELLEVKDNNLSDEIKNIKNIILDKNYNEIVGEIIEIDSNLISYITSDEESVVIIGENLLDESTYKYKKIINDNGVEVSDNNSSYYDCFIPVYGKYTLALSFTPQRVYYYNKNREFLGRAYTTVTTVKIPSTFNSQEIGFVKFQIFHSDIGTPERPFINYNSLGSYREYVSNTDLEIYTPKCYAYKLNLEKFVIKVSIKNSIITPTFELPEVWEPNIVDTGYSTPIGYANTTRRNWTAENKYTYYEFLDNYYNKYVQRKYVDGYRVNKKSLGQDSSALGYEIFEYDFYPINYSKVVMLSAGMNSLETSGIWGLATFVRELMSSEEQGMKYLRNNVRFKIIPFICPSSFDQEPLKYENYNGIRVNKNFSYRLKWSEVLDTKKGGKPDSETESVILKNWINSYAGISDLYIDCHSDAASPGYETLLSQVICSDSETKSKLSLSFDAIKAFYIKKGYATNDAQMQSWVETGTNYPKTLYSYNECGIPAIMIEQYISSRMFGSDGKTNNDEYGIKNYVTLLRQYIYAILSSSMELINVGDSLFNDFHKVKSYM